MNQPPYPFFTRFGNIQSTAWLSESVTCDVLMPQSYYNEGHVKWTRQKFENRLPKFTQDEDVLISREEFMVAYHAADAFLATAEAEFLPMVPVLYCTAAQAKEILRLASHPLIDRRTKSKTLLAIPKLTTADATLHIQMLNDYIADKQGTVATAA